MIIPFLFQESNKAMKVTSIWLDEFLVQLGCGSLKSAKKSCIVTLSLTNSSGSLIAPVNYVYPDALKDANVPVANVTVSELIQCHIQNPIHYRHCKYC